MPAIDGGLMPCASARLIKQAAATKSISNIIGLATGDLVVIVGIVLFASELIILSSVCANGRRLGRLLLVLLLLLIRRLLELIESLLLRCVLFEFCARLCLSMSMEQIFVALATSEENFSIRFVRLLALRASGLDCNNEELLSGQNNSPNNQ